MGEERRAAKRPGRLKKVFRQGVSSVVRTLTMGQGGSHNINPGLSYPVNPDAPPLRFHRTTHGENIQLQVDGFRAQRVESFCKGIVFSDRPVVVGERVAIRLTDLSSRWSGVLRVGFSNHNPTNLGGDLPKYACPDLTSRPGYWAKALPERYSDPNVLIHYYVSGNGEVRLGVNGHDRGVFFSGVDTRRPLWALIDLYGNCTGIELLDLRSSLNNFPVGSLRTSLRMSQRQPMPPPRPDPPPPSVQLVSSQMGHLQLQAPPAPATYDQPQHTITEPVVNHAPQPPAPSPAQVPVQVPVVPPAASYAPPPPTQSNAAAAAALGVSNPPPPVPTPNILPVKYNRHAAFRPLNFHHSVGKYAILSANAMVASRHEEEFSQCYVFSASPIRFGERIVIQVLATENSYVGSLAFGLTNCDPSRIDVRELPNDSDLLLNRSEYWVASKDVANSPAVGDELSFCVRPDGGVEFSKNGSVPSVFMHVDTSLRLFAFWDVYGNTAKIRLLGSTLDAISPPAAPNPPTTDTLVSLSQQDVPSGLGECTVCFERSVDCAIYTCGHMCMCHECAMHHWRVGGGRCPICRMEIKDIIRTFRA